MWAKPIFPLFLFFLVVSLVSSSSSATSSSVSNGMLQPRGSLGRSLLQQKTPCKLDLQNLNYTIMTSQCKGPHYTAERCCTRLKDLICPIRDDFNDLKSTCADSFFSYLNLYGKYPPGLFAALCREARLGLDCENKEQKSNNAPSVPPGMFTPLLCAVLMVLLM